MKDLTLVDTYVSTLILITKGWEPIGYNEEEIQKEFETELYQNPKYPEHQLTDYQKLMWYLSELTACPLSCLYIGDVNIWLIRAINKAELMTTEDYSNVLQRIGNRRDNDFTSFIIFQELYHILSECQVKKGIAPKQSITLIKFDESEIKRKDMNENIQSN